MSVVVIIAGVGLAISAALTLWVALRSRTVADRSVAIDVLVTIVTCAACVAAVASKDGTFADVVLALSLVGFIGAVAAGRFIDRRGL